MAFTGTRADFGLLRPVISRIRDHNALSLQIAAGGTHFSEQYGNTADEITDAGFTIDWAVDVGMSGDSGFDITRVAAETTSSVAGAIQKLEPDVALVLGDRYEALAFATACLLCGVPLAHIHGGETTEGAIDDAIRHAITQMSTLHFVAAAPFADRVIAMGALASNVSVVGAPGLDSVKTTMSRLDDPQAVTESHVGPLPDAGPIFLLAFHPETRSTADQGAVVGEIIDVLLRVESSTVIASAPNADWGRDAVADTVESAHRAQPDRVRLVRSFGHEGYVAAMMTADVVVGNSSSGIIEAPLVGTPTVDIGNRQQGRPTESSVFHSGVDRADIAVAVERALEVGRTRPRGSTVYGDGEAGRRIVERLLEYCDS